METWTVADGDSDFALVGEAGQGSRSRGQLPVGAGRGRASVLGKRCWAKGGTSPIETNTNIRNMRLVVVLTCFL